MPTCFKEELKEELYVEFIEMYVLQSMTNQKNDLLPCYSIRSTSIPFDVVNLIEDILFKTSKNLKYEKVFNTLKLAENNLPDIMNAVFQKKKTFNKNEWCENEIRKLKAAIILFPEYEFAKEPLERWRKIASFVHTKYIDECRYQVDLMNAISLSEKSYSKEKQQISAPIIPRVYQEEVKIAKNNESDDEETGLEISHIIGNKNAVEAAKIALKNSAKTLIKIEDVQMLGCALASFESIKIACICASCGLPFDAVLRALDTKDRLMNYSRPCIKCRSSIIIILNYNFIHEGNFFDAGCLVSVGARFMDISVVNFNITCTECDFVSIQRDVVPSINSIFNCFACHVKIEFGYGSLRLESTSVTSIENAGKYKGIMKTRVEQLAGESAADRHILKLGSKLPNNGTCRHSKTSYKWLRYICCGRLFPCDSCHNEALKHASSTAPTLICGFCSKEQPAKNSACMNCSKEFDGSIIQVPKVSKKNKNPEAKGGAKKGKKGKK